MPEFECQVYWHDLPVQIAPWANEHERRAMIAISREIHTPITPLHNRYFAIQTKEILRLKQKRLRVNKTEDTKLVQGIIIGPKGMTPLSSLNVLLAELGAEAVSNAEVANIVANVSATLHEATQRSQASASQTELLIKEAPIFQVLTLVLKSRGLRVSKILPNELRAQGRKFQATDLIPNKKALLICDKEEPLFAFAMAEPPLANERCDRRRTGQMFLHLFVPFANPRPWLRRVRCITRIDPNLCGFAYIEVDDGTEDESEASEKSSQREAQDGDPRGAWDRRERAGGSACDDTTATSDSSFSEGRNRKRRRREERATATHQQQELDMQKAPMDYSAFMRRKQAVHRRFTFTDDTLASNREENDRGSDAGVAPQKVCPFAALPSIEVKKLQTMKHVLHHWSQRLIEGGKRGQLYAHQQTD